MRRPPRGRRSAAGVGAVDERGDEHDDQGDESDDERGHRLELRPIGAVGDDADVDPRQLAHHPREQRAAEDLAAARLVRRADEDVGRAALARDALDGRDEIVAFVLEEVDAEDAGQPAQRRELCHLLVARRASRRAHPERVDLRAEPLRGAPGAAQDPLRLRLGLDQREDALGDRLLARASSTTVCRRASTSSATSRSASSRSALRFSSRKKFFSATSTRSGG